jgi:hypothetical protein
MNDAPNGERIEHSAQLARTTVSPRTTSIHSSRGRNGSGREVTPAAAAAGHEAAMSRTTTMAWRSYIRPAFVEGLGSS